jgi:hypothetical protein
LITNNDVINKVSESATETEAESESESSEENNIIEDEVII